MYSEHTFGASGSVATPDDPLVQAQWKIKQAYALDADRQSRALLEIACGSEGAARRHTAAARRRSTCSILPAGRAVKWLPFLPS